MNDQTQDKIAKELAELLAKSTLDEAIKDRIMEHLDEMPDYVVLGLMDALRREEADTSRILLDLDLFEAKQDEVWKKAEADQRAAADKIIDEEFTKL